MMRRLFIGLAVLLLFAGCGRKEPPQAIASGVEPAIVTLKHEIIGNSLKITIVLTGGSGGVGYQVDRAEIDPYCKCPGLWRRYYERPPQTGQAGKPLHQLISLGRKERAYRFRAVDGIGRLSKWEKTILAKSALPPE